MPSVGYSIEKTHQYVSNDEVRCAQRFVIPVSVHFFSQLIQQQRHNECCTFFFLFFKVRASKQVTRSRRSSVWPIPFFGRLLTSQSETEAGPREES